jgi:hypothetical protein
MFGLWCGYLASDFRQFLTKLLLFPAQFQEAVLVPDQPLDPVENSVRDSRFVSLRTVPVASSIRFMFLPGSAHSHYWFSFPHGLPLFGAPLPAGEW